MSDVAVWAHGPRLASSCPELIVSQIRYVAEQSDKLLALLCEGLVSLALPSFVLYFVFLAQPLTLLKSNMCGRGPLLPR